MEAIDTNVTTTVHREPYPAISPTRPELSQAGRTVLITGGATGIGKSVARNFVLASAATIILVSRRAEILASTVAELGDVAQEAQSPSKIIFFTCDVTNVAAVQSLWDSLANTNTTVDVLVLNAAKFTDPKPLFELGAEEVWSQFETNVRGPLLFADRFSKQASRRQKFLVNVSTQAIHMLQHPVVVARPAYSLTKATGTFLVQLAANSVSPDDLQIISFHPGLIYGQGWEAFGVTKDMFPFDEDDLPGAFTVWAASKESTFLHGRFVWASWDVNEMSSGNIRKHIDEDPDFLRIGVTGLKGAYLA